MKIDRFEVGKSYYANSAAFATVIKRTEKTVTFRVVYSFYSFYDGRYCASEKIVKKKIFMSGCGETFFIEYTKDENDLEFSNAYDEFEDVELFQAIDEMEKKLAEITPKAFNDLMTHVQLHYDLTKTNIKNGWRYYAEAYLCERVSEILSPLEWSSRARVCCRCRRDTIINEYLSIFSEDEINEYFFNKYR